MGDERLEVGLAERAAIAGWIAFAGLPCEQDLVGVDATDIGLDQFLEPFFRRSRVRRRRRRRRARHAHGVFRRVGIARRRPVPHAPAERCHVDLRRIVHVGDHPVPPLEVEAADPRPRLAPVGGAPGGLVEAARVERVGLTQVDRRVVDMLRAGKDVAPGGAGIRAEEDPAAAVVVAPGHTPCREIEPPRIARVHCERVGTVGAGRQRHPRPVLGAVGGAVERAVELVPDPAHLAAPGHDEVERAVARAADAPRERLPLRDAVVLQRPCLAVVGRLVEAAAESAGIERARALRARGVEEHVRHRRLGHARVREPPVAPAVCRDAHPALVGLGIGATPHLGPRQVVRPAEGAPHAPLHVGIEDDPVGRVPPCVGDADGRARPRLAAVVADVRVGDEEPLRVERVEVDAVAAGDVEPARGPTGRAARRGVDLVPGLPAVERAVGAEEVGHVADVGIVGRGREVVGGVVPDVAAHLARALLDPRPVHVLRGPVGLAVDDAPALAAVGRLRDAVEEAGGALAQAQAPEADVRGQTVPGRGGDRVQLRRVFARAGMNPALAQ